MNNNDIYHYLIEENRNGRTTACGLKGYSQDLVTDGWFEIYHVRTMRGYFVCEDCLNSEQYKNDLISFEIGFEKNEAEWVTQVVRTRCRYND